jgi:hypothetical protein
MQRAFLLLVAAQAAHSFEEVVGGLYRVFAPARALSGLVSSDPARGFVAVNIAIVAFGLWCWAMPVRRGRPSALPIAWGWTVVETANGIGHLLLAVSRGGYFPGALTAPLLLAGAAGVAIVLRRAGRPSARLSVEHRRRWSWRGFSQTARSEEDHRP